jgi:hypothetical protein
MAFVSLEPYGARRVRDVVERHGLGSRVSGYHTLGADMDEVRLSRAFADPTDVLERFGAVVRDARSAGADLVVPAEGVLNEVLWAHGVGRVDDVPVMDCVGVAFAYTELLVNLRARTDLAVGRAWEYAMADAALLDDLRGGSGGD